MSSRWSGICFLSARTLPVVSARRRCYGPDSASALLPGRVRRRLRAAGRVALPTARLSPGAGLAGAVADLMGADDVGVARVGWQRRLRPAGWLGPLLGDADLPHRWPPSGVVLPPWSGSSQAHRDQAHAQVAYLDQDPVQRWLVGHRPGDDRFSSLAADLEALEPAGPAFAEDPFDTDLVMGQQPRAAHAGPSACGPVGDRPGLTALIPCPFTCASVPARYEAPPGPRVT